MFEVGIWKETVMKIRSFLAAARIGLIIRFAQSLVAEAAEVKLIAGRAMSA